MSHAPAIYAQRQIGNVQVIATSRLGGHSSGVYAELNLGAHVGDNLDAVTANRDEVRSLIGASNLKFMTQYHSNVVHQVTKDSPLLEGDGLVTTETELALAAFGADCVTFALVDTQHGVIAAGHSGWKGLAVGLPDAIVHEFFRAGASPEHSKAVIAPAICGQCYEVSAERVAELRPLCPEAILDDRHIDVTAGVVAVLTGYNIACDVMPGCTFEDPNLYSFRRDGVTGRSALVVVIHPDLDDAA